MNWKQTNKKKLSDRRKQIHHNICCCYCFNVELIKMLSTCVQLSLSANTRKPYKCPSNICFVLRTSILSFVKLVLKLFWRSDEWTKFNNSRIQTNWTVSMTLLKRFLHFNGTCKNFLNLVFFIFGKRRWKYKVWSINVYVIYLLKFNRFVNIKWANRRLFRLSFYCYG